VGLAQCQKAGEGDKNRAKAGFRREFQQVAHGNPASQAGSADGAAKARAGQVQRGNTSREFAIALAWRSFHRLRADLRYRR
jgi:hypothetical protein